MGYPEAFNELEQWRDEVRGSLSGDAIIIAIKERIAQETDQDRLDILDQFLAEEHKTLGHHAAAKAIVARRPDQQVLRWHDDWRDRNRGGDIVLALEERMRSETHPLRVQTLRWLLAQEHQARGNYLAAQALYLAEVDSRPDSPRPLISLAMQKLFHEYVPEEAMRFANRAVLVAMQAGVFRREALGMKARIALKLSDHGTIESVLREIMQLTFTRGNIDIGAERDFFDQLPPNSITPDVAAAYHEYCCARGQRRTASEQQIRQFVLAAVRPRWLKVARIIADVLKECERNELATRDYAIAERIRALIADGKLEAQGNIAKWRYSEVRARDMRPDAENDVSSSTGTSDDAGPVRSIAGRVLSMEVGCREVEVPITIYAPVDKGDHWRCTYEIIWPDERKIGTGNGIDSAQALLIALRFVGAQLYTSKAHAEGKLKCPGLRAGYGFPLPWNMRDLAVGEDRYL
jgi:hypothetical protein